MAGFWDICIPKQFTNLVTNPSIETATTGYSTGGTNSIARSSEQARRGLYSLKCTYSNNDLLALYTFGTIANGTYAISMDIYVPSTYTGTSLVFLGTGGTTVSVDMTITDRWQRINTDMIITSGAGTMSIVENGTNGSAAEFIYTDGWQVVLTSEDEVTYIDGDQPGARWIGTPHASKSESDGYEPGLGYWQSFRDDLHFVIDFALGSGLPPVNNLSSPLPLQPGTMHDDQTVDARYLTLRGTFEGNSAADWHPRRQALLKALNSKTARINQKSLPRLLRVTSPDVTKEIRGVYDTGLADGLPLSFTEKSINLKFKTDDPLFYDTGETSQILDTHDAKTFAAVAARINGSWNDLGPPSASGTYDTVHDVLIHEGKIYVTGDFENYNNVANADFIAVYDIDAGTWAAMGTGLDGVGRVLAKDAAGNIYAGGDFDTAGGTTVRGIAVWDGSSWAALGPPSSGGSVYAIAISTADGHVYIGGSFENWDGDAAADRLASWDGSAWSPLSTGATTASSIVKALQFNSDGSLLYIGGDFEAPQGRIMTWDGSAFAAVGSLGSSTESVNTLIFHDNVLYAGGDFTGPPNFIATWNGAAWSALPLEVNGEVVDIAFDNNGIMYACGLFTLAGAETVEAVALFNGSVWTRVDVDFPANTYPFSIDADDTGLLVFGTNGGRYTAGVAGTTTISYEGTYNAYPIFEITRTGGTFADLISLRNHTTNATIYAVYQMRVGEKVTIDFRPGQQTIMSSLFGPIPEAIFGNSDTGQFFLVPGNEGGGRDNIITCFVMVADSAVASLRWRDTYISED